MKTYHIWLIASLLLTLVILGIQFDLQVKHFEDGSGRITYCVPFSLCARDGLQAETPEELCRAYAAEVTELDKADIAEMCQP